MNLSLSKREKWIILGLGCLTVIAHFLNLGLMPLFGDESLRGTVAFEMMKRENYIVPTIWGEFYYRKPPFYNWILMGVFSLTGSFSEFVLRLPSVIPLMLFGATIWWMTRKYIGERAAVFTAFAFVLSGRLLTRDSMLGHIDIFYSWCTFIGFYSIHHFWKRNQLWALFLISYLISAAGVLMKGLPSFLFQGITLFVWFVYKRQFKVLFSLPHFAGIGLFVAIVGGYFWAYSEFNSLEDYFLELYDQSSQRTVIDRKWYEGILNILTFPFENFGHLFPTSLLLLFVFRKGIVRQWLSNDFLAFTFLTLAVNVLPYWLSPGYYPRYLFMLYPLVFVLGCYELENHSKHWPRVKNVLEWIMFGLIALLVPAFLVTPFVPQMETFAYRWWVAPLLALMMAGLVLLWFRMRDQRVYWFFFALVVFRIGFDAFVLPYRVTIEKGRYIDRKNESNKVLSLTQGGELRVLKDTPLFIEYAYYLGTGKDAVIWRDDEPQPGMYYLTKQRYMDMYEWEEYYQFPAGYREYQISLVKLKEQ